MSSILKDFAILLYSAGNKIDEKAYQFKKKRKERYKEFEEKYGADIDRIKEKVNEAVKDSPFASKKEIDELKLMILELTKKVDSMSK